MAVAPTAVALTAVVARTVGADSTAVAADTTAGRVLVAGGQPPHGKRVRARIGDPVD